MADGSWRKRNADMETDYLGYCAVIAIIVIALFLPG